MPSSKANILLPEIFNISVPCNHWIRTSKRTKELTVPRFIVPFPEPVKTKTKGEIPEGSPNVAISSPTAITAALAAAREGYIYDAPSERKGVE